MTGAQITKMFKDTFSEPVGQKCLKHLEEVFVDRNIARPGDDLLTIGIRQGEAQVIRKIIAEVNRVKQTRGAKNGR